MLRADVHPNGPPGPRVVTVRRPTPRQLKEGTAVPIEEAGGVNVDREERVRRYLRGLHRRAGDLGLRPRWDAHGGLALVCPASWGRYGLTVGCLHATRRGFIYCSDHLWTQGDLCVLNLGSPGDARALLEEYLLQMEEQRRLERTDLD